MSVQRWEIDDGERLLEASRTESARSCPAILRALVFSGPREPARFGDDPGFALAL